LHAGPDVGEPASDDDDDIANRRRRSIGHRICAAGTDENDPSWRRSLERACGPERGGNKTDSHRNALDRKPSDTAVQIAAEDGPKGRKLGIEGGRNEDIEAAPTRDHGAGDISARARGVPSLLRRRPTTNLYALT
jgi:hypothetical protein